MTEPEGPLTGRTISHYHIHERLGSGGMGEVYRAQDERLERDVALKVISSTLLASDGARRRFRREALSLSKLNHSNIATVYDFDSAEGLDFIAMELVTGPTLSSLLDKGAVPTERVLQLGRQMADGLEAAHRVGIVHRDVKPGNIRLTPDGQVKILDFGLAQLLENPAPDVTLLESLTATGMVVGTLPYMAPEQLRGDTVDARTDIYSLGAVLYEMSTGRRPHVEPSTPRLIDAILNRNIEPPSTINRRISADLQTVIMKALDRNPERRYQSAKELSIDLARVSESGTGLRPIPMPNPLVRRIVPLVSAAIIGALLLALGIKSDLGRKLGVVFGGPAGARHDLRQISFSGYVVRPSISPDGRFIAYRDDSKDGVATVYLQDMLKGDPVEIFHSPAVWDLRWSPDGSQILISTITPRSWEANLVPLLGGKPREYLGGAYVTWAPDGSRFAFANVDANRLGITNIATGDTTSLPISWPYQFILGLDWHPRGDRILLATNDVHGRFALWTIRTGNGLAEKVLEDSLEISCPRWSPGGDEILFLQTRDFFPELVKIKPGRGTRPSTVFQDLRSGDFFSFTKDGGKLAFAREERQANLWMVSRKRGAPRQLTSGTFWDATPAISPNGRTIAFARGRWGKSEIFSKSIDGDSTEQLTFMNGFATTPVWSPDGTNVAFGVREGQTGGIWTMPASGGTPRRVRGASVEPGYVGDAYGLAWDPAPNLVYLAPGKRNVAIMDPQGGTPQLLLRDESLGWIMPPRLSPEGDRVAYGWHREDFVPSRQRVWIGTISTGAKMELPDLGDDMAQSVRWSPDGKRLYVHIVDPSTSSTAGSQGRILAVSPSDGRIEDSFELPIEGDIYTLDVTPDGQSAVCSVARLRSDIWLAERSGGKPGGLF